MKGAPFSWQTVLPEGYFYLPWYILECVFNGRQVFLGLRWIIAFRRLHCREHVGAESSFFTRPRRKGDVNVRGFLLRPFLDNERVDIRRGANERDPRTSASGGGGSLIEAKVSDLSMRG